MANPKVELNQMSKSQLTTMKEMLEFIIKNQTGTDKKNNQQSLKAVNKELAKR
jgi:hypothetical protein